MEAKFLTHWMIWLSQAVNYKTFSLPTSSSSSLSPHHHKIIIIPDEIRAKTTRVWTSPALVHHHTRFTTDSIRTSICTQAQYFQYEWIFVSRYKIKFAWSKTLAYYYCTHDVPRCFVINVLTVCFHYNYRMIYIVHSGIDNDEWHETRVNEIPFNVQCLKTL